MSFNPSHNFDKSRDNGIKLLGFRGCARRMMDWEACQRALKEAHVRTKPKMVAVNSTGGFKINKRPK